MINPAEDNAEVRRLLQRVRELEDAVKAWRERTYCLRATVTAFTGGSTTLTVAFTSGEAAEVRYLRDTGYTPAVGHKGWVLCGPEGNVWLGRDSVP